MFIDNRATMEISKVYHKRKISSKFPSSHFCKTLWNGTYLPSLYYSLLLTCIHKSAAVIQLFKKIIFLWKFKIHWLSHNKNINKYSSGIYLINTTVIEVVVSIILCFSFDSPGRIFKFKLFLDVVQDLLRSVSPVIYVSKATGCTQRDVTGRVSGAPTKHELIRLNVDSYFLIKK